MRLISDHLLNIACLVEKSALRRSGRRGPDFVCFGMQKAGTRWLYEQMNARKDVWMPPIKEIDFFINNCFAEGNLRSLERNAGSLPLVRNPTHKLKRGKFFSHFRTYQESGSDAEWYRRLFDHKGRRISGDISPNYSEIEPDGITRIAKDLPRTKFILLIREPVDRAWSALCMNLRKNRVSREEITNWDTLLPLLTSRKRQMKSLPSALWQRWTAEIPADRIRYWFFDDICTRPQQTLDEVCGFLEIKPGAGALPANFNRKEGNEKIEMPDHIRMKLTEHYAQEIEACASTFGGHAIRWREKRLGA
jgi:hypothetical protein